MQISTKTPFTSAKTRQASTKTRQAGTKNLRTSPKALRGDIQDNLRTGNQARQASPKAHGLLRGAICLSLIVSAILPTHAAQKSEQALQLTDLKVESISSPLGLDESKPRFSWRIESSVPGIEQKSYAITVTDEDGKVVWNSGKVKSGSSIGVEYSGEALQPQTEYSWSVSVVLNKRVLCADSRGQEKKTNKASAASSFETGLLNPSQAAWKGAEWIGGGDEDLDLNSDYLSVFVLSYDLRLDEGSTRASFIFGADDPRLMDESLNKMRMQNAPGESFIELCLNADSLSQGGKASIDVYRYGYAKEDSAFAPLFSFPIDGLTTENINETHNITYRQSFGQFLIEFDGVNITPAAQNVRSFGPRTGLNHNLNPAGTGGDYNTFPVLAKIGYRMDPEQMAEISNICVRNYRNPGNVLYSDKGGHVGGSEAVMQLIDPSHNGKPMLRKSFSVKEKPAKARLYLTARGIYEAYLNGERIGEDYFNPGLTQYNKTLAYQVYDITEGIKEGENAIGAILGEGWWSGQTTYVSTIWNFFGDRQSLLAMIELEYSDGSRETIVSDGSWKFSCDGPYRMGSFFQGEVYDARREAQVAGWTEAGFNDSAWKAAVIQNGAGIHKTDDIDRGSGFTAVEGHETTRLVNIQAEAPRIVEVLTAVSVDEVRPGVFIYDMGQNMVGVPSISFTAPEGREISLRYSEVLYPDLPEYRDVKGELMVENLRAAIVTDKYTSKGGLQSWSPALTFHGYRYLEIRGLDKAPAIDDVKGLVISSMHSITADYATSDAKVNRLWQNILWSSRGNFLSIPTDCPQRNERMGWSGDLFVFSKTAVHVSEMQPFLEKHLRALRDTQRADGYFTDVAPLGGGFGGILWGSVGMVVPWEMYCQYGDVRVLEEHYGAMEAYVGYLLANIDPETGATRTGVLGDWLSPVNGQNDNFYFFESYFIRDLELMSKAATVLGRTEDARKYSALREERKARFNKLYPAIQSQACTAVPLAMGAVAAENIPAYTENLAKAIETPTVDDKGILRPEYSLLTGFISTACISEVLSANAMSDYAYRLLLNDAYPSWLYPVTEGATSIWERLDSYTSERGFGGNNSMNSFNHYSFGAVGAWMIQRSLGIMRDESSPGFKHFYLMPEPDPKAEMSHAEGWYDSPYGRISSSWEWSDDRKSVKLQFTVPANTSASLILPFGGGSKEIKAGTHEYTVKITE